MLSKRGDVPPIILIGGTMTLRDGSQVDSRQPLQGDPSGQTLSNALMHSWFWWDIASSVVLPILDGSGTGTYALIYSQRSVKELKPDGSIKRTRLSGLLRGGVHHVKISQEGVDLGKRTARWRFLQGNPYYFKDYGLQVKPEIIIDLYPNTASETTVTSSTLEEFESSCMLSTVPVVVLPHVDGVERFLNVYCDWIDRGRPKSTEEEFLPLRDELFEHSQPIVIGGTFQITAFLENGAWKDPGELEAARSLLHSRYDLRIGFWDLVRNPTLRQTLLSSKPTPEVPAESAKLPRETLTRAEEAVAKKAAKRAKVQANKDVSLAALSTTFDRLLAPEGWKPDEGSWVLALTDIESRAPWWDKAQPLALLRFLVTKQSSCIRFFMSFYNDIDLVSFLQQHRSQLEEIAGQSLREVDEDWILIDFSHGWGNEADWEVVAMAILERKQAWKQLFRPMIEEVTNFHASRNSHL